MKRVVETGKVRLDIDAFFAIALQKLFLHVLELDAAAGLSDRPCSDSEFLLATIGDPEAKVLTEMLAQHQGILSHEGQDYSLDPTWCYFTYEFLNRDSINAATTLRWMATDWLSPLVTTHSDDPTARH